ncbi:RNA polymerase sigma factor [Pedobacter hartonius]|uniref:RNA polymerase sigma-70 factor, ECF subfamily n=1 Tax=Pedobacter hartonius TaxID=425514 RepID=A0A1H3YGX7_9SPHI|nr:sigma-70 family RNA polymerase sigma factor [Pedobacter hartonius]SEA10391.1 RNA polymerase sigma-70 factor, ECF subfamily [Pedobacter hartonius]
MKSKRKFLPEEELVKALKNHDEYAMDILYHMYSRALLRVIYSIVKQPRLAEDLSQETFIKIWESAESYDSSKGRLFTWMLNIARNTSIDVLRSKDYRNQKRWSELDESRSNIDLQRPVHFNPDTIGVRQLVYQLKPEFHSLLEMTYYQGYFHTETADALNMPLGTVKTRLRNAIIELRGFFY